MKNKILFLILAFFQLILCLQVYGQKESLLVKVVDQDNNPIPKAKVSIERSRFYETGSDGSFEFVPEKKLIMPYKVEVEYKGYVLDEFYHIEDQREIEVILKPAPVIQKQPFIITLLNNDDETPVKTVKVSIDGSYMLTDNNGEIAFYGDVTSNSVFLVSDHEVMNIDFKLKKHKVTIFVKSLYNEFPTDSTFTGLLQRSSDTTAFQSYKDDFTRISNEIIAEKLRLEKKNLEIREEIERITNRLRNEKTLTYNERRELQKYLEKLEGLLRENSIAFHKAEEKTNILIYKLRLIILERDSIAYLAKIQIAKAEKEKKIAEAKFRRNVKTFSVVTGVLLLLAIGFYLISLRFKRQKKQVEKVNKDLKVLKDELVRNVEEVSRQKAMIEDQNAQLDTFVYKASHDIKGPLRSVIGLTQTGMKMITDPVSLEFFEHILKSTQKLDNLLLDLLNLTKAKKEEIERKDINVLQLVKECLISFENLDEYKSMQFNTEIAEDLTFCGDQKLLYSIIQNFIENAIKYKDDRKKNPYLTISAGIEDHKFMINFIDNGLGIDKAHQPKIFDMFYKVNPSSNGTGLGLHIVKLNIEKMNGEVKVVSDPGKGSTFTVIFNLETEENRYNES